MSVDLKRIVEALIFVSEAPLPLAQLCAVLETEDKEAVAAALAELVREYQEMDRAFIIVEVAGGYGFRTRPELAFWLRKLKRDQVTRLSRASLETLAVIAYKQPVMKAEIERLRGVEVSGVLRMLMEKDLVKVVGRKDLPGRPLIYGTTKRFLEVFDLKDLKDLPTLEEMQALAGADAALAGPGETGDLFAPGAVRFEGEDDARPRYAEDGGDDQPGLGYAGGGGGQDAEPAPEDPPSLAVVPPVDPLGLGPRGDDEPPSAA
ncbi:MAG: SMC-Scp complex subunit ScpB [Thermodesulfobacteriota bacterium]